MSITINKAFDFSQIKGVIFDLDGTLANSNPNFAGLRAELGIAPATDILSYVNSITEPTLAEQTQAIIQHYELESSHGATWIAGAPQLMAFLTSLHIPQAILTRNMPEAAHITLANLDLTIGVDFDPLLTRFDAKAKPHPEGVERICAQWQIKPANILFIGDYLFDLQTANNAGTKSILYTPSVIPDYAYQADIVCQCYLTLIDYLRSQLQT
ncbi:HAD family hydrolase [Shewanella sp. Isolate13]|uniref:HAD family hydrolase n=1 Tax=Shewanella sp. Isolate13 TaxID=2908531 RepID=UPI001EFDAE88|nr:HAD family hydrolase [Shewanella sp. Isolate13]MCG9729128.1 HAD family hydrolase [Shewanella sp. Isolate13]